MAGGSQIIISSDGITIKTPKEFKVFAGQHKFESGVEVGVDIRGLPSYQPYNEKFKILSPSGEVISNLAYQISNADHSFTALTDQRGLSKRVNTSSEQDVEVGLHWISLEKDEDGE